MNVKYFPEEVLGIGRWIRRVKIVLAVLVNVVADVTDFELNKEGCFYIYILCIYAYINVWTLPSSESYIEEKKKLYLRTYKRSRIAIILPKCRSASDWEVKLFLNNKKIHVGSP